VDDDRFSLLVDKYRDRVFNQAYRMLGNTEDAEEATQDVFLRVYRSIGEFRGDSKITTWIYRITSNVCISRLRKKQLEVTSLDEPFDEDGRTLAELIPDEAPGPESRLESKQTAELVRAHVRTLPPNWAMALSLHHFEGLSYDETAEAMEIPKATAATYIFRARRRLAQRLAALIDPESPPDITREK